MILLEANLKLILPVALLGVVLLFFLYRMYKMRELLKSDRGPETSEHTLTITDANFEKITKKGVTLIDCWAPWCAPCRIQGPIINDLANDLAGKANIGKLDVDQNKQVAAKLGIRNIPTIFIFKDGEMVKQFVGVKPKSILLREIENHL
jgi:thioredoxin 1